jgi:hypothetical protein
MAYVPGYKHDIFVSYARADDQFGWVTEFVNALTIQLDALLGRKQACDVWWDRADLDEAAQLTKQFETTLRDTTILVVVLSKAYDASPWCADERRFFLDSRRDRPDPDRRSYLVDIGNLPVKDRPAEFSDFATFEFWETGKTGDRQTLGFPKPNLDIDRPFYLLVNKLAKKISKRLAELRDAADKSEDVVDTLHAAAQPPGPIEPEEAEQPRRTVFLARVTDDLDDIRKEVIEYLDQAKLDVVPVDAYPTSQAECQTAIESHIGQSVVFAQVLGPLPGKRLTGVDNPKTVARLQFDCAKAAGLPVVQWRIGGLDVNAIKDADHRELLTGTDVWDTQFELFKEEIVRLATPKPDQTTAQRKASASTGLPFVFVNNGVEDLGLAEKLVAILGDLGCFTAYQVGNGDPKDSRKTQRRNLLDCDAVIYLYGQIAVSWVREQLRLLHKAVIRRKKPLHGIAICKAPPGGQAPIGMSFPHMSEIDCCGGLSEKSIGEFVKEITQGGPS